MGESTAAEAKTSVALPPHPRLDGASVERLLIAQTTRDARKAFSVEAKRLSEYRSLNGRTVRLADESFRTRVQGTVTLFLLLLVCASEVLGICVCARFADDETARGRRQAKCGLTAHFI